jgi:hypothetical protein
MTGTKLSSSQAANFNKSAVADGLRSFMADDLVSSSLYEPASLKISGKIAALCSNLCSYRSVTAPLMGRISGTQIGKSNPIKLSSDIDISWAKEYIRYQLETIKSIKSAASASDLDDLLFCGFCQNTV